ncbi:group II intron reverse transcriptase domain-containing protein [Candidatus Pacearchaeota archaeon]|nr:hypothetical protein [uncultured archaeon]MBS3080450.1 group II intron reverse transcriptase domain-containing protein [Candidatus Pacearchaeota archaeon]
MKTNKDLYEKIYNLKNLISAWEKAKKGKTKKQDIKKFNENLAYNINILHDELKSETYYPKSLTTFILRDPKTRNISKSNIKDRIVHHALVGIIEPIFESVFIHDSCANRKGKGTLFALQRFEKFIRIVSKNNTKSCFVLKADIKHYFQEVNHEILISIIKRKIKDEKVLWLIERILEPGNMKRETGKIHYYLDENIKNIKGIPLGNLTSQFFANVYLNELDYFVKHKLKCKYYIRYVDDFVILHSSKKQLEEWKIEINNFLKERLKLELHPEKSRIIFLSRGIDFVGFRNFYYHKLLRKRNLKKMEIKINSFNEGLINYEKFIEIFQGWEAYALWADSHNAIKELIKKIKV